MNNGRYNSGSLVCIRVFKITSDRDQVLTGIDVIAPSLAQRRSLICNSESYRSPGQVNSVLITHKALLQVSQIHFRVTFISP